MPFLEGRHIYGCGAMRPCIAQRPLALRPHHRDLNRRPAFDGLVDHAVALGQLQKLIELLLRLVGSNVEAQPDLGEPDRRVLGNAERPSEIEITRPNWFTA